MSTILDRVLTLFESLEARVMALEGLPHARDGRDGVAGRDGACGPPGDRGPAGDSGSPGPQGPQGPPGCAGEAGAMGPQGPAGERGQQGPQGECGAPGPQGPAGVDGRDGAQGEAGYPGTARGLHDPAADYRALDVVTHNGSEWRARCDNPGPLPGNGWMLGAKGVRGKPGEAGARGERGPPGVGIAAADIIDWSLVIATTDARTIVCDLRPLFERYDEERNS